MNIGNKRKEAMAGTIKPKRMKKECDYGERCYRRNPAHFREFSHKHLEVILDDYPGSGDYPIPDKYVLERLTIMEQLDVIVEKEIYTPWIDDSPETTTSDLNQQKTQNTTIKDSGGTTNKLEPENSTVGSRNTHAGSSKTETNNRNSTVSKNIDSSRKEDLGNGNVGSCNKDVGSRSKDVGSSSNDFGARNTDVGSSKNVGTSKDDGISKRDSNASAVKLDYKKAPGYRPIVPPTRRVQDFLSVVRPANKMAAKHAASAPYHIFYTTITASKETHSQDNSITFLEILDPSLGELQCSLQINFMVEVGWLLAQYYFAGYRDKKLTILYGEESNDLKNISQLKPQVDAHRIAMPTPFGSHHTKMMVLCYEDSSLRVVISTANLYIDDWENRTQGLWFSPACRPLPSGAPPSEGDSCTGFKRSLLQYLGHYRLPALAPYVERIKNCDFSHINVFLCASVPGSHPGAEWGLLRVGGLLRRHAAAERRWPLLAQASSIGSYGPKPQLWLTGDFLHNFTTVKDQPQTPTSPPELKLIYPSLENVRQSHDGLLGGGCLPYGAAVHSKQTWLNEYLYQWKATSTHRNKAMPHIKSYTRVSTDNKMASYHILTSANCSKAAWGSVNKGNGALRVLSYEAGVLLLPQFVINKDYFPLEGVNRLKLAYDIPPTKYTPDMTPWVMDYLSK